MSSPVRTEVPFRCATAGRVRGDSPAGTAPLTRRWLLIEHPGPWRADALAGSGLPADVLHRLQTTAAEERVRILLIRRPGRQRPNQRSRRWAISGPGGTRWGRWAHPHDLVEAAAAVTEREAPDLEPLILVCTHGVHDICCAIRGRPVAAALQQRWPDAVWECSHLGGDRFAGNIIVLPDGAYYGLLDETSAPRVVQGHLAGRMDAEHLRGLARFPPVAQVAVVAVLQQYGPFAAAAVRSAAVRPDGPQRWRVEVTVTDGPVCSVSVETSSRPAAVLTCHAGRPTTAVGYAVTDVRPLP